ncbi:MAG: hypothetical protein QNJ90_07185 [Planctomycetota bacterium]|nr:hypothetical protein [Planctomycetota bacterium]
MRTLALVFVAVTAIALAGCSGSRCEGEGCGVDQVRALNPDLPANPSPDTKYCKVWVPPTYRKVPVMRQVSKGGVECENVTVMRTEAKEVMVAPPVRRTVTACDEQCEKTLVMVKPGGYRWEKDGDCCWQYRYRSPEYKWCEKTRKEEGIEFCYEHPPEYKTVVTSKPVQRARYNYVPPKYEVEWVKQEFTPGRWEWKAEKVCKPTEDKREFRSYTLKNECKPKCPPKKALDCGCPSTN